MAGRAKTITNNDLNDILNRITYVSSAPLRDVTMVALSFKGGLRACELAKLTWSDVTDPKGNLADVIRITARAAKNNKGREIPMPKMVREFLAIMKQVQFAGARPWGPVLPGFDGQEMAPNTLQRYLGRLYRRCGYELSSHSGRRTCLTNMARVHNDHGCSIYDVQAYAGHADISTTEAYVDRSERLRELVDAI